MLHSLSKKGRIFSLFLCLLTVICLHPSKGHGTEANSRIDDLKYLSQDPVWSALLHARREDFLIRDPNFLLSWPNVSLENEIIADFNAFKLPSNPNTIHAQCKFPARFMWITDKLSIDRTEFPSIECRDYIEYQEKAPADTINLVFASENVASPSSMMGHTFLVLGGINTKGFPVSHAVSYYTVLDSYNLPKIMTESLITGMQGLFSLAPYQELKNHYLENEGRNIWEYELNISDADKALIHGHIWELKEVKSDYYFHWYNCATLTNFVLAIAEPRMFMHSRLWISPSDVVKDATEFGLIQKSEMTPSDRWKIKMFIDQMNAEHVSNVYSAVQNATPISDFNLLETKDRFLSLELDKSYVSYLAQRHKITAEKLIKLKNHISKMEESSFEDYRLDLSAYKNPVKTPDDTQASISYGQVEGRKFFQFSFLPIAHRLQDDNRQYFTENELRLGDIKVRFLPDNQSVNLHEFTLYSVKTITPWDRFTRGLSAQWKIGIEPHYDDQLVTHEALDLDAALGSAWSLHPDIMLYGMLGAGYGYGADRHYLYSCPEAGIVIDELFDLKSYIKTRHIYNQLDSKRGYWDIEFTQSWFPSQKFGVFLNSRLRTNRDEHEMTVDLSCTVYF